MTDTNLHLASSSERRRDILNALGLSYTYAGVDIDESPLAGESVEDTVCRLALAKAQRARETQSDVKLILSADTLVALPEYVLGKPEGREEALRMLSALSGCSHRVLTSVALLRGDRVRSALSVTEVAFRHIDTDEALRYWHSGEPAGKAGAYAIQGLGGIFVRSIVGSYSTVVGLPVFETAALLREAGLDVLHSAPTYRAG